MNKRALLIVTSVMLVFIVSAMCTLAYLTDRESVVNTFTIGNVDIDMDEAKVDENGAIINGEDGKPVDRVKENEYHLVPGQSYVKDPTITVEAGSEESFVRMILNVHNASAVQKIIDTHKLGDYSVMLGGWDQETWIYKGYTEDKEDNTISFEFRYKKTVDPDAEDVVLPALFKTLDVPGAITGEEMKALYEGGFKIVVYGHAIQKAVLEDEDTAWEAFDEQGNP